MPLTAGMDFFLNADVSYEDEKPVQVHNLAWAPEATVVGARLGVEGENWSATLFGRNLTDEDAPPMATRWLSIPYFFNVNTAYLHPGSPGQGRAPSSTTANPRNAADTGGPRAFFGSLRKERQFGAEFTYRF